MIYLLTNGKTCIKTHEEVEAFTSTTDHWLHKRYSKHLIAMLFKMISTNHEERPTAEEIRGETFKNERKEKPELMFVNRLEEFIALQSQLVALLPKAGGESEGGVVNVGDSIDKLSNLFDVASRSDDRTRSCQSLFPFEEY